MPAASFRIGIQNRQRARAINTPLLRRVTHHLLAACLDLKAVQLDLLLVGPRTMARINEQCLGHPGPTDVITFDYSRDYGVFGGEIVVCPAVAVRQAPGFNASWQSELARYVVHGVLHLRGHDDTTPALRRIMRKEETRLLRQLADRFKLDQLG